MGATNFYSDNADGIFEVNIDEFFQIDDLRNTIYELLHSGNDAILKNCIIEKDDGDDGARSYRADYLALITFESIYKHFDWSVEFKIKLNRGYYLNGCLDYSITWWVNGEILVEPNGKWWDLNFDIDDIAEGIWDYSDMNLGQCNFIAKKCIPKWERITGQIDTAINKIFKNNFDGYIVVSRASNGECFYSKI